MACVQWTKHTPGTNAIAPPPYHPSISQGASGDSGQFCIDQPNKHDGGVHKPSTSTSTGRPYYTTDLVVPIQLPPDKAFVPTFHSCFISRTYRLCISLSLSATASLTVKVPIQVTAEGNIQRAGSEVMQHESEITPEDAIISGCPAPLDSESLERCLGLATNVPPDYGVIVH
ncbi:putative arrestin domain-containing protein [Lasiodiplodia theobromae]|nr:putative arrestin domain-containing protein [Lasiodiplodia theobromae]